MLCDRAELQWDGIVYRVREWIRRGARRALRNFDSDGDPEINAELLLHTGRLLGSDSRLSLPRRLLLTSANTGFKRPSGRTFAHEVPTAVVSNHRYTSHYNHREQRL